MGVLRSWFNITSFQLGGNRSRCSWKISVKLTTMGGRLGLSSGNRLAPAEKTDLAVRAYWKMDQRRKPQRVKWSGCAQSPLYTQWPRLKSSRGRQYRNTSRAGHVEILSQTRAVSGMAAVVTTPLRFSSDDGAFGSDKPRCRGPRPALNARRSIQVLTLSAVHAQQTLVASYIRCFDPYLVDL
jgi:hypothetical protein